MNYQEYWFKLSGMITMLIAMDEFRMTEDLIYMRGLILKIESGEISKECLSLYY